MPEFLKALQAFLPVDVYQTYVGHDVYELFDKQTHEQIGLYSLNKEGELNSFSLEGEAEAGPLSKEDLLAVVNQFMEVFMPEKRKEFELSSIIDLDNPYMISFERRDEKYGLFLHSTGVTISVSTSGQVHQFFYDEEEYQVVYPDKVITETEAFETYMNHVAFELEIMKFEQDTFQNVDNEFHLVYSIHEKAVDVPAVGGDLQLFIEQFDTEPILQQEATNKDLYHLLGLTSTYLLTEVQSDETKRMEVWPSRQDVGPASLEMDEVDPHMVKLSFDAQSSKLLQVTNGLPAEENGREIDAAAAKKRALDVLFKLYPDAHLRFRMSKLTEEDGDDGYEDSDEEFYVEEAGMEEKLNVEEEFEDEEEIEFEDTYTFYFHLMKNGIPVHDCDTVIGIGKYTGSVRSFQLNVIDEAVYRQLPTTPTISREEAERIYTSELKMEKAFVREYDENDKAIYSLSYRPSFPKTVAHVRAIEALTGEPQIVDMGDAVFYD